MPTKKPQKKTVRPDDAVLRLTVDGRDLEVRFSDISSTDELDLYNHSQLTVGKIGQLIDAGETPVFVAAALVFLARRQAGEKVTAAEVFDEVTYDTDIDVGDQGDAPEPAPEA